MAQINQLQLTNFRNFDQLSLELNPKTNLIIGSNAAGKTSIIESIWLLSTGRSFRTNRPNHLIKTDTATATVFCEVEHKEQQHKLGLRRTNGSTELKLNGLTTKGQSSLAQHLPVQLLTPESNQLLTEGPKSRRQLLDWGCFYHYPEFLPAWRNYQRTIKQRNQALKAQLPANQITLWNAPLIQAAEEINSIRQIYLDKLTPHLVKLTAQLMPNFNPEIELKFYPGWSAAAGSLEQALEDQLEKDRSQGYTQAGCHRADIRIKINSQDPVIALSRGQQKVFTSALLLAQASFHQEATSESVIMLIDDLPAELDEHHRHTLIQLLADLEIQHLITTTSPELIPQDPPTCSTSFYLEQL